MWFKKREEGYVTSIIKTVAHCILPRSWLPLQGFRPKRLVFVPSHTWANKKSCVLSNGYIWTAVIKRWYHWWLLVNGTRVEWVMRKWIYPNKCVWTQYFPPLSPQRIITSWMPTRKARCVLHVGKIDSYLGGGAAFSLHVHAGGCTHKIAVVVPIICSHGTNQFDSFYRSWTNIGSSLPITQKLSCLESSAQ